MVCNHDRHGNQPGSNDNRYVLSHAANMPSDSPLFHLGSSGGRRPLCLALTEPSEANSRNSARLPRYLAARRVVPNPFIIVAPRRSQTRHSHLVGHRLVISTSNTAGPRPELYQSRYGARCCSVSNGEPLQRTLTRFQPWNFSGTGNASLGTFLGTFRLEIPNFSGFCSAFVRLRRHREMKKAPYFRGFFWSEREDLNLRPLVSQTSALTGLRHAPMPQRR
jgi:hypothetical protein